MSIQRHNCLNEFPMHATLDLSRLNEFNALKDALGPKSSSMARCPEAGSSPRWSSTGRVNVESSSILQKQSEIGAHSGLARAITFTAGGTRPSVPSIFAALPGGIHRARIPVA